MRYVFSFPVMTAEWGQFYTFANLNQIYATYSMMTGLLSTIAVGILLLLIISVIVITIFIWFPDDQKDDRDTAFKEVRN